MTSSYLNQSLANMKIAINLNERDIVKLIIEFLANRELHIAMLDLERETGIINSAYSDDILFLRQLILDGQWDDCIEFVQPLKQIEQFNWKQFYYLVLKSQYVELLCLKSEANAVDNQLSVDQLVAYLNDLKQYCPTDDDYKRLCYLLTVPRIQDLPEYKSWNPSTGRLTCFTDILPLISRFLPPIDQSKSAGNQIAQNERLVQLIVKGLLYEACVEYCQARATSSQENYDISDPNAVLMNQNLSETDASLLSWLHALSVETFSCPFEEKPLKLNMERFVKPTLEATWAEAILATPIKPQQLFPYNAVPSGRSKNMELMSRSLAPQYEGLTFGMTKSQLFTSGMEMKLTSSIIASGANSNQIKSGDSVVDKPSQTAKKISELTKAVGLLSTSPAPVVPAAVIEDNHHSYLNDIKEEEMVSSPTGSTTSSNSSAANRVNNHQTASSSTSMPRPTQTSGQPATASNRQSVENSNPMQDSQLFQEYRKHKAQVIQQFEEQEKKREEYVKQLKTPNVQNALSSLQLSVANQNSAGNKTYNDDELSISSATKSPTGSQTGGSQADTRLSKSPRGGTADFNAISPSPSFNNKPVVKQSNNVPAKSIASVNESTTRFESLEEITKAASFLPVSVIEDQQAVRAVDIHPSGNHYVVGSNSKCLRICSYPNLTNIKADHVCKPATVLYKKSKHHYGSIYCTAWNPTGNLIATGSNDKTIKLVKFNPDLTEDNDSEQEIAFHNGTVRDLVFMQQTDNNILISGGAGDCRINVLDCQTQQTLRNYSGHTGHIFSLYTWASTKNVFVSGSQDKSIKFWDLRSPDAIQTVVPTTSLALEGSPVASVAVDSSGLIMASGHEDAACCLYDIRGSRIVQIFKPHTSDIRSVRFSSNAFYLLTASYDNRVIVTDLHGDLTKPLFSHTVAQHSDKVIQAKWHPELMSFVTTSADRTSIVWSLPSSVLANAHMIDRD